MWTDVKDSGKREEFTSGSVRDTREGKGRFDLLPVEAITRIARHYEAGARKYADRNWEKGQPISRYIDSALRHTFAYLKGERDEDHLAAACWNLMAVMHHEAAIDDTKLSDELADLPWQRPSFVNNDYDYMRAKAVKESIPCPAEPVPPEVKGFSRTAPTEGINPDSVEPTEVMAWGMFHEFKNSFEVASLLKVPFDQVRMWFARYDASSREVVDAVLARLVKAAV